MGDCPGGSLDAEGANDVAGMREVCRGAGEHGVVHGVFEGSWILLLRVGGVGCSGVDGFIVGRADNLLLEPEEGAVAFAVEERHVDSQEAE